MRRFLILCVAMTVCPLALLAAGNKGADTGITVAGTTRGNVGCVILEKHMPVKRKLLFAGVIYARTEYRVLQAFHYKPARQKYAGQGEINELNREAVKNKIKLVVLPSNYSEEQMKKARTLCGR
jgi:hypothetical protein